MGSSGYAREYKAPFDAEFRRAGNALNTLRLSRIRIFSEKKTFHSESIGYNFPRLTAFVQT